MLGRLVVVDDLNRTLSVVLAFLSGIYLCVGLLASDLFVRIVGVVWSLILCCLAGLASYFSVRKVRES
jgi:hypothetical protein